MDELTIELETAVVRPGGRIEGRIQWSLSAPPERARLRLRWWAAGECRRESCVVTAVGLDELAGPVDASSMKSSHPYRAGPPVSREPSPLAAAGQRTFDLSAPITPVSFIGRLMSVSWELEVSIGDETKRVPIVISPTLAVVSLQTIGLLDE